MAGGVEVKIEIPQLDELRAAFRSLPKNIAAKHMGAALRKAVQPGFSALKAKSPKGPTGNLKRAVSIKVKKYTRDGSAVALAGYVAAGSGKAKSAGGGKVRAGKDRAFHQGFVEFGTKSRSVRVGKNGYAIASSYKSLGPFKVRVGKRGKNKGVTTTSPRYPKAFLMAGKKGQELVIRPMPAQAPVRKSFEQSLPSMKSTLATSMTVSLNAALKEMASPFRGRKS